MLSHLKKIDWALTALVIVLVLFGAFSIYSTGGDDIFNFKKQMLWLIIGVVVMFFVSMFDYRNLKNHTGPVLILYGVSVFLVFGVLIFGVSVRGSESWYRLGPLTLEPVEFVKIALIVLLAKYFSMRHIEMYSFRHVATSGAYVFVPAFFVFLQPDIGSVVTLMALWLGIMLVAGIKIRHLAVLAITGIVLFLLMWSFVFHDYQRSRLVSFINPDFDPRGGGYNVAQSIIAVGSSGFLGGGIGAGTQSQLGFLPEAHTDFIYSAITEETGLLGALLLFVSFAFLFGRIGQIAKNAKNNFARFVVSGFSILLFSQIIINIGVALGLFPVTGIPLPFVSYGGSSLISLFLMLGIVQSVNVN